MLEKHERDKFALWCEQNAESARLLVKQMEKQPYAAALIPQFKMEIAACVFIANKLRSTTDESIGG